MCIRDRSRTPVPGGTAITRSPPDFPCRFAPRPRPPGSARKWCVKRKSRSVVRPASTWIKMEPPRPPSPPSGPPLGTWASRRNVAAPSPPSPARTQTVTRSRNIAADCRMRRGRGRRRASEVGQRVDADAAGPDRANPDFEVAVRARGGAGGADTPDRGATSDGPPGGDRHRRHVIIGRIEPAAVRDPDLVATPVVPPAGERDDAGRRGVDRRSVGGRDVEGGMTVGEVLADIATRDRPGEPATAVVAERTDRRRGAAGRGTGCLLYTSDAADD